MRENRQGLKTNMRSLGEIDRTKEDRDTRHDVKFKMFFFSDFLVRCCCFCAAVAYI